MEVVESFVGEGVNQSSSVERDAVTLFLASCPLNNLFSMLGSTEPSSSAESTLLRALTRVYTSPDGIKYLSETTTTFAQGLSPSAAPRVRESSSSVLCRLAPIPNAASAILSSQELAEALVSAVGIEEDVSAARHSADALATAVAHQPHAVGAPMLEKVATEVVKSLSAESGRSFKQLSVTCMRHLDLVVRIACTSDDLFSAALATKSLDGVMKLIEKPDPLLQLNVIDLVGRRLCSHPRHVAFLLASGIADWLISLATGDEGDSVEPDPLLGGDALRVISIMFTSAFAVPTERSAVGADAAPEAPAATPPPPPAAAEGGGGPRGDPSVEAELHRRPELVRRFLKAACAFGDASSESQNTAAIDAVSHFAAASASHLGAVVEDEALCRSWLTLPSRVALKASVLHSLAHVLSAPRPCSRGTALGGQGSNLPGSEISAAEVVQRLPQPPVVDDNPGFALPNPPNHVERANSADVAQPLVAGATGVAGTPAVATASAASAAVRLPPELTAQESVGQLPTEEEDLLMKAREDLLVAFGRVNGSQGKGQTIGLLLGLLRQPISELRHGAYDVLRATVAMKWGLEACVSYGGFFLFMENRDTESTKEGKDWKFLLIQTMAANPHLAEAPNGASKVAALRLMIQQGPYYLPWRPEGPVVV